MRICHATSCPEYAKGDFTCQCVEQVTDQLNTRIAELESRLKEQESTISKLTGYKKTGRDKLYGAS